MPELVHVRPYAGELLKRFTYSLPGKDTFLRFAKKHNLDILGCGQFSGVFPVDLQNDKDRVFAWDYTHRFYDFPLEARLDFYTNHILNRLHPEHFPVFTTTYNAHIGRRRRLTTGGSIRERVFPARTVVNPSELEPIREKQAIWFANGIPLGLDFHKLDNWVYNHAGNLVYLDVPHKDFYANFDRVNPWHYQKIEAYLKSLGRSDQQIKELLRFAKRMRHLEVLEHASRAVVLHYQGQDLEKTRQELSPDLVMFILYFNTAMDVGDVSFTQSDLKLVEEKLNLSHRVGKI